MDTPTSDLQVLKSHAMLQESLGAKELAYVEARALGAVPVAAARMAGFGDPADKARELEANRMVRMAVETEIRVRARETSITRKDVEEGLKDAVRMSANSNELRLAWVELGKLHGLYEPKKVEIAGSIEVLQKQITAMDDDELAKHAAIDGEFEVLDFDDAPADADTT